MTNNNTTPAPTPPARPTGGFHCNCGEVITGTKRDIAAHLAGCATVRAPGPRPPAPAAMTADSDIIDPTTGEVIAEAGQLLDDEVLYRMEHVGIYIEREAQARRCPHYGAEVPIDFVGCAECLIARECYELYELAQARERWAYRGVKLSWDTTRACYSFTFRDGGRSQRYGAPTIEAAKALIDQLHERRAQGAREAEEQPDYAVKQYQAHIDL